MAINPRRNHSLRRAFRSRRFLWTLAISFLVGGAALGCLLHAFGNGAPEDLASRVLSAFPHDEEQRPELVKAIDRDFHAAAFEAFEGELTSPALRFDHLAEALPRLAPLLASRRDESSRLLRRHFLPSDAALAEDFIALYGDDPVLRDSAERHLQKSAAGEPAPRFVNQLLGMHAWQRSDHTSALRHFVKEGVRGEAASSRRNAIRVLISSGDFVTLDRLSEDPAYADVITADERLQGGIVRNDWPAILKNVPLALAARHRGGLLALTLIAGFAWAFFLFHLGEVPKFFSTTTVLCAAGFLLGVISTTPTIYAVIWQDHMLGFNQGANPYQLLAYNIGGIGLREEICKLLLFLPLLPFLLKRGDEREALLVASFVGLGFAVEENSSYLLSSYGADAPGRFLTANFFHLVLTGLNGLALFRAIARGGSGWNEFFVILPLTILVHGLYDGLPRIPQLMEFGGYLAITLYVLSSLVYFQAAHELRENVRITLGLTGAFVLGLSLVAASVLVDQISSLGLGAGLARIVPEFIGTGILVLMFLRVFDEPLAE